MSGYALAKYKWLERSAARQLGEPFSGWAYFGGNCK